MPGLNRRGPDGEGPKTGRMMGLCTGKTGEKENLSPQTDSGAEESIEYGRGRGLGRQNHGRGKGFFKPAGMSHGAGRGAGRRRGRGRGAQ